MQLSREDYLDKVMGCWLGKNIGGTLGAPMEWYRQINNVSFYTQELKGDPVPNDDLDLQLVWLHALEQHGVDIDAKTLADYWLMFVGPHFSEYGTAKSNLRFGLLPPLSGTVDNPYKDSCGAFIRTEIWACIAPGLPEVAARYAYEDAIVDHGDGEGTYAAVFTAALQSAAFVISDVRKLIDIGLSYIPADCGVAKAIALVVALVGKGKEWREIRDDILRQYRGSTCFNDRSRISDADFKKGFFEGKVGYDVPSNIAIYILGLLLGEDDFDKILCITVNCGEDTDCTAATVGALWGIIHGGDAIPEKWIEPIGRNIQTICVNSAELYPPLPKTVEELTDRTERLARQVLVKQRCEDLISEEPTDLSDVKSELLMSRDQGGGIYSSLTGPKFEFELFTVCSGYPDGPFARDNQPTKVTLTVHNKNNQPTALSAHWYLPEGWKVLPSLDACVLLEQIAYQKPVVFEFELESERVTQATNRFVVELTATNRAFVMQVPLVLLNGNYRS